MDSVKNLLQRDWLKKTKKKLKDFKDLERKSFELDKISYIYYKSK